MAEEPQDSDTDYIKNASKQKLFVRCWTPIRDPIGVVFISHGIGEHSGRYEHLGRFLKNNKYAVHSHDHVGHGESKGEKVFIEDFQIYVRDVIQHIELLKAKYTNIPLFLFGHSMGGTVAALVAMQKPELLNGVVFSAPAILPAAGLVLRSLARTVAFFAPQLEVKKVDVNTLSRIPEEVKAYVNDPLVWHGGLKAGWAIEMCDAQSEICRGISTISLPFITIHGTGDTLVDISSSQFLYDNAQSEDKTFEKFEGGFHELVNDLERDRFKQVILDWLNKHTVSVAAT